MNQPPSNGPATLATPKTAPKYPWYRPRSRGGMMSPMMLRAMAISPPPPMPWMARKAINWGRFWLSPHSADPTRKMRMAAWKTGRRP